MSSRVAPLRLTVIADLHMSAGVREGFHEEAALADFLEALGDASASWPGSSALVVLGDLLDFSRIELDGPRRRRLDTSNGAALLKLDVAAREHREALSALGRLAVQGVDLELVAGNHDLELVRPTIRERLRELMTRAAGRPAARASVRVHPWLLHLPGLLYAEHGHQHHIINRTPGLLRADRERVLPPLGTCLGECLLELEEGLEERALDPTSPVATARVAPHERPRRLARDAAAALRLAGRGARWALATRAGAAREDGADLLAHAADTGLPVTALAAIDAAAATRLFALARMALRAAAGDRFATGDGAAYMLEAARSVHRILAAQGAAVPFYLFGHTHRAADVRLGADGARYLNPGTWSSIGSAPEQGRAAALTFVEVVAEPGRRPCARLMRWDRASRRGEPLREPTPDLAAV
jgi:UDP-2,3-diacylglucosamine pyrophosphatase LpxH